MLAAAPEPEPPTQSAPEPAPPAAPAADTDVKDKEAAPASTVDQVAAPVAEPVDTRPYKVVSDSCTMQGRHSKQEDRHVKIPDLTKAAKALKVPIDHLDQPCSLFAVYDGHQGHLCAEFVAKGFHGKLLKRLSADTDGAAWTDERIKKVLAEIFEELDVEFLAKFRTMPDGCTLAVAFLTGERLFVASVGDTQCLLVRRSTDGEIETVTLTEDHRAHVEAEAARVKEAGGVIVDRGFGVYCIAHPGYEERLREMRRAQASGLGTIGKEPVALAVTRALGDRDFKAVTGRALLIPTPEVKSFTLTRRDRCVMLMCDGITNYMSNEEILVEMQNARASAAASPELQASADCRAACGALVQEAYKRESQDNLTVILVRLEWRGEEASKEEEKVKRSVEAPVTESAAAVSKRRRLDAAAAVNAQKVAAYERAVAAEEKAEQSKAAAAADREASRAAVAAELQAETEAAKKRKVGEANSPAAPAPAASAPEAATPAPAPAASAAEAAPAAAPVVAAAPATASPAAATPTAEASGTNAAAAAEDEDEEFFL